MERERTKLVEEGNTIYEIDLDCMRRKKMEQEKCLKNSRKQARPEKKGNGNGC